MPCPNECVMMIQRKIYVPCMEIEQPLGYAHPLGGVNQLIVPL
jgi:hypothetical protein